MLLVALVLCANHAWAQARATPPASSRPQPLLVVAPTPTSHVKVLAQAEALRIKGSTFLLQVSSRSCVPCHQLISFVEAEYSKRQGLPYYVLELESSEFNAVLNTLVLVHIRKQPVPVLYLFQPNASPKPVVRGFFPEQVRPYLYPSEENRGA